MNKPLTPEEAKNLTFPCLLEIWNQTRISMYDVVIAINAEGHFIKFTTLSGANYTHAALPSPNIAKAMSKQFRTKSKFIEKSMEDFSAYDARKISQSEGTNQLGRIIPQIKTMAQEGMNFLCVFEELTAPTIIKLISKGFQVKSFPKEKRDPINLCHHIKW